jgi:hypothetical protein
MSSMNAHQTDTRSPDDDHSESDSAESDAEPTATEDPAPLSLDEIFEVLKNERRRHVIHHLKGIDEQRIPLGDLAEHIAAKENEKPINALSSGERKRVYVGLYQCHLPKMDDMGIVDFNQDRGIVGLGPNVSQLEPYLEPETDEESVEWHRYYLTLAIAGSSVLGMMQLWGGSSTLGSLLPLGLLVGALGFLSVCHTLYKAGELPRAAS